MSQNQIGYSNGFFNPLNWLPEVGEGEDKKEVHQPLEEAVEGADRQFGRDGDEGEEDNVGQHVQ